LGRNEDGGLQWAAGFFPDHQEINKGANPIEKEDDQNPDDLVVAGESRIGRAIDQHPNPKHCCGKGDEPKPKAKERYKRNACGSHVGDIRLKRAYPRTWPWAEWRCASK